KRPRACANGSCPVSARVAAVSGEVDHTGRVRVGHFQAELVRDRAAELVEVWRRNTRIEAAGPEARDVIGSQFHEKIRREFVDLGLPPFVACEGLARADLPSRD